MNGTTMSVERVLFKRSLKNVRQMWPSLLSTATGVVWSMRSYQSLFQWWFNGDFIVRGYRKISFAMWSSEGCDVVSSCHVEPEYLPSGRSSSTATSNQAVSRTGNYRKRPFSCDDLHHRCRVWNLTIVFPISNTFSNGCTALFLRNFSSTTNFSPQMPKLKSSKRCWFTMALGLIGRCFSLVLYLTWKTNTINRRLRNDKCGEINFEIVMSTAMLSKQGTRISSRSQWSLFGKTHVTPLNAHLCVRLTDPNTLRHWHRNRSSLPIPFKLIWREPFIIPWVSLVWIERFE